MTFDYRYSTIWMGRALPDDGILISLEINDKHVKVNQHTPTLRFRLLHFLNILFTQVARENLAKAGLEEKCKIIAGSAVESMANLYPDDPFDLVFIDADKGSYPGYFAEAKRLVKKGGVIVCSVPVLQQVFSF